MYIDQGVWKYPGRDYWTNEATNGARPWVLNEDDDGDDEL
jgi:hypothetical protein